MSLCKTIDGNRLPCTFSTVSNIPRLSHALQLLTVVSFTSRNSEINDNLIDTVVDLIRAQGFGKAPLKTTELRHSQRYSRPTRL